MLGFGSLIAVVGCELEVDALPSTLQRGENPTELFT